MNVLVFPETIDCRQTGRRLKLLAITPDMLLGLFKNEEPITLSFVGLPQDARSVGVFAHEKSQQLYVIVQSDSFPEVLQGALLEHLSITVCHVHPGRARVDPIIDF